MLKKKKLLDSPKIYSYKRMQTNFSQYGLSFFLSFLPSFSLFLALFDFWWSLKASDLAGREIWPATAQLHIRHQTTTCPWRSVPLPILSKVHSCRASLRSDLCDAWPLLRRSTSGVGCSFLIEHDHGSLVHGRKPLFVGSSIDIYSSLNCRSNKGLACQYCHL